MTDVQVYLQLSTAQGPAECQTFAAFALKNMLREAEAAGVSAEIMAETPSKHGLLSATLCLSGAGAEPLLAGWLGTWQWVCPSPLRPRHPRKNWYIGVSRLPAMPPLPADSEIRFQTCRASGKGGQHVNKTDSAVRATHLASGVSVRVESERSQHANKQRARELLALKLAEQHHEALGAHAQRQHSQLYQVARGNPQRVFHGTSFREVPA